MAYDGAGRLKTVTETPKHSEVATRTATYTYDNAGNRTRLVEVCSGTENINGEVVPFAQKTTEYLYKEHKGTILLREHKGTVLLCFGNRTIEPSPCNFDLYGISFIKPTITLMQGPFIYYDIIRNNTAQMNKKSEAETK